MKLDNSVNSYAKWTLILGAILIFILPFSVSFLNLEVLGEYGPVGDTIGGITSPVSQLLGSILIYLALKAQLDANTIIHKYMSCILFFKITSKALAMIKILVVEAV